MKAYYYASASEDNNHEKPKRKENKKKLRDNRRDTRSSMKRKIGRSQRRLKALGLHLRRHHQDMERGHKGEQ